MGVFTIREEFITLGQLLKATDMVASGGEIRGFLAEGVTTVNGEPESRRGRKLRRGDVVVISGGTRIEIA